VGLWHFQPAKRHYRATTRIERSIRPDPQAGETGCGCVVLADVIVRFPDGSLLRPDVAIYCREPEEEDTAVTLIPEAVVEVVSKGSEMKDFEIGPAFYLGQGVKDVIVFDPFSLLTIHHRRDRPPVRYSETTEIRLECGCLVTV
ncbi:Uma2 family endonuclease, partial [bacterium]